MKNLEALRAFQIKPTTTKLVIGGAQEYYCWTSGSFTYTSDTDDTGNPSESGDPINCSPIAVVSASAPHTGPGPTSGSGSDTSSTPSNR